jgi:hypothetical protein
MHASCIWQLLTVVLLLAELRWSETQAKGVNFVDLPVNKLAGRPDLSFYLLFASSMAAMVTDARLALVGRVAGSQALCKDLFWSFVFGLEALKFASSPWCLPASVRCFAELQRLEFMAGFGIYVGMPNNKLALPLVRRRASRLVLPLEAVMVAELKQRTRGGLNLADRGRANPRWSSSCSSAGACLLGGRWLAIADMSPHLLAEGQLPLFLQAKLPLGRQFNIRSMAMACFHGSLVAPSGAVPGDGEVVLDRRLRTRSLFRFSVWGPSCKVQGLVCIFQFFYGPVCKMCCPRPDE